MKKYSLSSICFFVFLLCLALSCNYKDVEQITDLTSNSEVLIREAQTYFQTLDSDPEAIASSTNAPSSWIANRAPQWGQAVTFVNDGKQVVEVPLLYNNVDPIYTFSSEEKGVIPTITEKNGVTKALFFKHKDGSIAVYIMKLILDPDYFSKVRTDNQYKKLSFNTVSRNFSGVLLMLDWNEQLLDTYLMKDGKITARTNPTTSLPTMSLAGARTCQYQIVQTNRVCVGYGNSCCTPTEFELNPASPCCRGSYETCYWQSLYDYVCSSDIPPTEPSGSGPISAETRSAYANLLGEFDILQGDPLRPHVTVIINKPCQGEALRELLHNAQLAQTEYNGVMHQCLAAAGFASASIEIMSRGGIYNLIVAQMKNSGGKGVAAYRATLATLGFGNLGASVCINDAYNVLQTKYIQYESNFKNKYNSCN